MPHRSQIVKASGLDKGIRQDVPLDLVPAGGWSDGLNIRYRNGRTKTSPGWLQLSSQNLNSPVKHLAQFLTLAGVEFAVAVTNIGFWYYDTGTGLWVDATGATALTGLIDDFVDSDVVFDLLIFTNNADRVKKWAGSLTMADLGGLATAEDGAGGSVDVGAAKSVASFNGFVHLFNTKEDGNRMAQRWRWSRFGQAEGWDNISDYGQAGFTDITDGPDKGQTCRRLGGDFLALYKEKSIHIAQYVGPPTVWSRRLVVNGVGLMAPGAVTDIVNEHVFLGNDNFYIFNGLSIKPIGDAIWDTFISQLNPAKAQLIWAHTIYEDNEVIFAYPSGGSEVPNKAVVYNYINGAWAFRDMPFLTMGYWRRTDSGDSWDSDPQAWDDDTTRWDDTHYADNAPLHLAGDDAGLVHSYGDGYSQNGASHDSYAITGAIDLKKPAQIKRFLKIMADLVNTGNHSLAIYYLTTKNKNATLNWSASRTLSCDLSSNPWVTIDKSGRYLFAKFRTNGTNNPWDMSEYGCEYIICGRY